MEGRVLVGLVFLVPFVLSQTTLAPTPSKTVCDNDWFCAPDFGSFSGSTVLGICMSFVGNFINSVGYILQKIGYRHLLDKQEENPEASITSEPYWIIGFVTYAVGSLTHGAALGFASQALLVPMEGVTLVANAFLAPIFLGEKLGKMELIGSAVCCVGIVTTVLFGPNSEQEFGTDDLLELYVTVQFIIYGTLQIGAGVACWVALKAVKIVNENEGVEYDGTDGTMEKPRARRSALLHVGIAGVLAAFNVLFLKTVSTVLLNSPEPASERFAKPWPYMFIVLFAGCNFSMEVWKQRALQQFESVYIVPVFQAALIVLAVLTGGVYFKEFNEMKPINLMIFGMGLSIVAGGVFCLALEMESNLRRIMRTKVLRAIRSIKAFGGVGGLLGAVPSATAKTAKVHPEAVPQMQRMPSVGLSMGGSRRPSQSTRSGSRRPSQSSSPVSSPVSDFSKSRSPRTSVKLPPLSDEQEKTAWATPKTETIESKSDDNLQPVP